MRKIIEHVASLVRGPQEFFVIRIIHRYRVIGVRSDPRTLVADDRLSSHRRGHLAGRHPDAHAVDARQTGILGRTSPFTTKNGWFGKRLERASSNEETTQNKDYSFHLHVPFHPDLKRGYCILK